MKRISILLSAVTVCIGFAFQGAAQIAAPPPAPEVVLRTPADLDQMLGPIALYPDPLIAQILPAASLPSEIVLADRYVASGADLNLIDQQPWDASIKALARYPSVLKWMDDNLAWTTALGQAFLYQQPDVMDSIQRLRIQAQALGNLQTTPQETVLVENGMIEILPPNPEVIYVPVYQPQVVFYQRAVGVPFITFGLGLRIGLWLNHDLDWHDHHLIVWHHDHPRPANWWFHRPGERPRIEVAHATVWQPRHHADLTPRAIDRGWDARRDRDRGPAVAAKPVERHPTPAPPARRSEPPAARPSPGRPASGALIGVQSSRETHQFSNRGQASRQQATPPRASTPERPGGPGRH